MTVRNPIRRLAALAASTLLASTLAVGHAQGEFDDSRQLDWTIAFGPGGGNDIMARTLIEILDQYDLYDGNIVATNRAGGSGAVGWGHVQNAAGDDYVLSTTSGSFITTPLLSDVGWTYEDFTPIALLAADDMVLLVQGSSEIDDLAEFVVYAQANPVSIGGIGAVNVDFIVPTIFAQQAGFEFDYVSFNAAGELNTALLSGALTAIMSNPGEILGLLESGDLKALAFSGVATPDALGDLPTFAEEGYPIGVSMPRGLILPPLASQAAIDFWTETMQFVVTTPEWVAYIDDNLLTEDIRFGQDFKDFLGNTVENFETILRDAGAID
jgi:putative tricarboxylic transport membrane protein